MSSVLEECGNGMRLAVVMYTDGGLSGGATKYLRRMVPRLFAHPAITELCLFLPGGAMTDIPVEWDVCEWKPGRFRGSTVGALVRSYSPDLVFVPTARWFDTGAVPSVVMVRNMEPLEVDANWTRPLAEVRQIARRHAARRACERADAVIAVSDHVGNWLEGNWGLSRSKVAVVPHGVDPPEPGSRPRGLDALGERRFLFSAGSIRPARGLTDLLTAMAQRDFPSDVDLVFAGKPDSDSQDYYDAVLRCVTEYGLSERVYWLGHCDAQGMNWCFANCELFVMTSRAEACPNTVLEALSHGCLSVSCNTEPMPEFFGEAALYYNSGNPTALTSAVARALALKTEEGAALRGVAKERAAKYTWDLCAYRTVTFLTEVLGRHEARA